MTFNNMVKALISGMALPAIFVPFAYTALYFFVGFDVQVSSIQFLPLFLPLLFGITNLLHFSLAGYCPIRVYNWRLWQAGAILGLIVAALAIFVFHLPTVVFGATDIYQYVPFVVLPIIYGAIFRYFIKWINTLLEIPIKSSACVK